MNKEWKNFCPLWLYKIVVSVTVYDYVVRDIGIFVTQKKYTNFFAEMYDDLNQESIELGVNLFLQFLGELKSKDPFMFLNHYMYHIITDINPNKKGLFKDIDSPFVATRYHSLIVDSESLPSCFEITATLEDSTIMAISHKEYKNLHGVQFHPESVLTQFGHKLISNFLNMAEQK